jgi:hypothetical protein
VDYWASWVFLAAVTVSEDRNQNIPYKKTNFRGRFTMTEGKCKNWRESCRAALEAKDRGELLRIFQELNKASKREEQIRRDVRGAMRARTVLRQNPT